MSEVTHQVDPVTGRLIQIVSAARLTEILRRDGETMDRPKHFGPADEWDVEIAACESGEATGEPCAWDGEADDLVVVEWMPEHLRSSHEAAGNWGVYPYNGAERLRCCPACAEMLQAEVAS